MEWAILDDYWASDGRVAALDFVAEAVALVAPAVVAAVEVAEWFDIALGFPAAALVPEWAMEF